MCRDFTKVKKQQFLFSKEKNNKSVIKMSFQKLNEKYFHESLILAQDERWRRA